MADFPVRGRVILALLGSALAALSLAAPAPASAGQFLRGFLESGFASSDEAEHERWFDESVRAGASVVHIDALWSEVRTRPANPTDPADPAYRALKQVDAAVIEAAERGQEILLASNRAPSWAEGPRRPDKIDGHAVLPGTWKPDPQAYGQYAEALARRYSGNFSVDGVRLPRVNYFQAWAEPNLLSLLSPQFNKKERSVAAKMYRKLLNSLYEGVKRGSPSANVVAGETAAFGGPPREGRTRPLDFFRDLFCLRGKGLKRTRCKDPAKFDILSHHPVSPESGPRRKPRHKDDVTVGNIGKLRRTLRAAEKRNTLGTRGRHPIWVTELWWETDPPETKYGIPLRKHARWLAESMYLLAKHGVSAYIWSAIVDERREVRPDQGGFDGWQMGLFTVDGKEKPSFQAFRFPFVADRKKGRKVIIWTIAPSDGNLAIQRQRRSTWKTLDRIQVRAGVPEKTRVKLGGKGKLRGQVNGEASLAFRVGR